MPEFHFRLDRNNFPPLPPTMLEKIVLRPSSVIICVELSLNWELFLLQDGFEFKMADTGFLYRKDPPPSF